VRLAGESLTLPTDTLLAAVILSLSARRGCRPNDRPTEALLPLPLPVRLLPCNSVYLAYTAVVNTAGNAVRPPVD